jgi:hypothetical protein
MYKSCVNIKKYFSVPYYITRRTIAEFRITNSQHKLCLKEQELLQEL